MTQNGDSPHAPQKIAKILTRLVPEGWRVYDKVLYFTPKNLYEHINGRAEFYIAYEVRSLTFVSYENKAESNKYSWNRE